LGCFWLHEGIFKYNAHFGGADIGLVVSGARSNARVPDYFAAVAHDVLGRVPDLFGVLVPLTETGIGLLLVVGLLTLPAALASLLILMTYWMSDQLIAQYPIMGVLSAIVLIEPTLASHFSATTLVDARLGHRPGIGRVAAGPLRRWL